MFFKAATELLKINLNVLLKKKAIKVGISNKVIYIFHLQ